MCVLCDAAVCFVRGGRMPIINHGYREGYVLLRRVSRRWQQQADQS